MAGGEPRFRDEAAAAIDGATSIGTVPITVDLTGQVLAIQGDVPAVDGVVTALVVQAACLHTPDDLLLAAAVEADRPFDWMKWLPHMRSSAPSTASQLARTRVDADGLVRELLDVARQRALVADANSPHVLAILDDALIGDAAALASLLELAPAARIAVVWIAVRAGGVPHQARLVLEVGPSSRMWSAASGVDAIDVAVEPVPPAVAERVARALAPVKDVAAGDRAGIARDVSLVDVEIGIDNSGAP